MSVIKPIELSNGHVLKYVIASGALAFDGKGWWFEKIFFWLRLIKPELFTIVLKTLTLEPRKGYLVWWHPWTCIWYLWRERGVINKVGLTNPGFVWWCTKIAPKIARSGLKVIVSIHGTMDEILHMVKVLNDFRFIVGIEVNLSCPNTGKGMPPKEEIIEIMKAAKAISIHPLLLKLSATQECVPIASALKGVVEAIELNSVSVEHVYPEGWWNPLCRLVARVGGGGGGVSGEPAQKLNWEAVEKLVKEVPEVPVIAPSVMSFEDVLHVQLGLGARAVAFGVIHLYGPWKPTQIVLRLEESETITIRRPDDFHVHLRLGEMLINAIKFVILQFARALIMPNTDPPILDASRIEKYEGEINAQVGKADFKPLMTLYVTDETTPEILRAAHAAGAVAIKIYPKGVTTNSHLGVSSFRSANMRALLAEAQRLGMIVCIHGQQPGEFCLDREKKFIKTLWWIVKTFRKLRIVVEHVSTATMVSAVKKMPARVGATITLHHLLITLHDILCYNNGVKEGLNPHNYCQPIPQRPEDLEALWSVILKGNPKFFFGSDSAPHLQKNKETCCGAAGVFSGPVLLPLLAQAFVARNALRRLEPFTSEFGARHYGLPLNQGTITLVRRRSTVPDSYDGVVPFWAGKTIDYEIAA